MDALQLQVDLASHGCYSGPQNGVIDKPTQDAVLAALSNGPEYAIETQDVAEAAGEIGLEPAVVWAFRDTETNAKPFVGGRTPILFEPHRFSRATGHRYDASHPHISSAAWNRKLYPASQDGRWAQLLEALTLDVDAAFASASYGAFQILGENYQRCDCCSPFAFAWQESRTEADQLHHFVLFVKTDAVLLAALKRGDWSTAANRYNGTASTENHYAERLAANVARRRAAA